MSAIAVTAANPLRDLLMQVRSPLEPLFLPRSVAVIGATETPGSVGRRLFENMACGGFKGCVYPVHPTCSSVFGNRAYPCIRAVPQPVDLALVATPAATVPAVVHDCADANVKAAVIVSAGFRETGAAGLALEQQVLAEARRSGMRLLGPNCLGIVNPHTGLNATFVQEAPRPGNVAFLSQSGALGAAILDWSLRQGIGFSAFVSVGSMLDIAWGELIDYLADDPHTTSILLYMESIGDARLFLSAAREVALTKPIIVVKAGRTQEASKAAASHTGSSTGSDAVVDAAFRRSGVLRVDRISSLFYLAEALARQPRPQGPRLTILSNAGGPAVMAADALIAEGGRLAELGGHTIEELNAVLPPHWSHGNPVDILGDATAGRYADAMSILVRDAGTDGFLVILSPQGVADPAEVAGRIQPFAKLAGKPVLASWMGGCQVAAGEEILKEAGIPAFPFPDTVARVFHDMWRYSSNLMSLYEMPAYTKSDVAMDRERARALIDAARASGRELLAEVEAKEVLACYGIGAPVTRLASSEDEAVGIAAEIGYPVVLKLHSHTVTHKTEIGGVQLNLANEQAVRAAYAAIERVSADAFLGVTVQPMVQAGGYELILGSSVDSQFGPVILFGTGGALVEAIQDRALALPPLNTTLALRLMEQTRIFPALAGTRGHKPVDVNALAEWIVRFSLLVTEQPWIREIDINPLLAAPGRILALDARMVLHPADCKESDLPRTAIRPYPAHYSWHCTLKDGSAVWLRPIRPEDEPLLIRFHLTLQDNSVYLRYFHLMKLDQRIAHERLARQCAVDYDREIALVAEFAAPARARAIAGVGRMKRLHGANSAELAVIVSDPCHNCGLGEQLVGALVDIGRQEKLDSLVAVTLPDNLAMQHILRHRGFELHYSPEDQLVEAELRL